MSLSESELEYYLPEFLIDDLSLDEPLPLSNGALHGTTTLSPISRICNKPLEKELQMLGSSNRNKEKTAHHTYKDVLGSRPRFDRSRVCLFPQQSTGNAAEEVGQTISNTVVNLKREQEQSPLINVLSLDQSKSSPSSMIGNEKWKLSCWVCLMTVLSTGYGSLRAILEKVPLSNIWPLLMGIYLGQQVAKALISST